MKSKKHVKTKKSKKHTRTKKTYKKQLGGNLTEQQALILSQEQQEVNNASSSLIRLSTNVGINFRSAITFVNNNYQYQLNLVYDDGKPPVIVDMTFPSVWSLSSQSVADFKSHVDTKLNECDCLINAMQMIGLIDVVCANVLRIGLGVKFDKCVGGINDANMLLLFSYLNMARGFSNSFFLYDKYIIGSGQVGLLGWRNVLNTIPPGKAIIAGYQNITQKISVYPPAKQINHVFIIYMSPNNKLMLIDPQLPPTETSAKSFIPNRGACALEDDDCAGYLLRIADKLMFYVFAVSVSPVTNIDWIKELDFNPDPNASGRHVSQAMIQNVDKSIARHQQPQITAWDDDDL